jgi:hypothetical protein
MQSARIYCSARDQDVQVVLTDVPSADGHANLPDVEIICLEIGERCTGSMCPIGAESPEAMAARLARSGLGLRRLPTVRAHCDGCERATDLAVLPRNFVACTECGTTSQWATLRAG